MLHVTPILTIQEGLPTTKDKQDTSLVTTVPIPTIEELCPIFTPFNIIALLTTHTCSSRIIDLDWLIGIVIS